MRDGPHWMVMQGPEDPMAYRARFESIGARIPEGILSTGDLMAGTRHHTRVDLERLTGIRARHVAAPDEDSFTLAVGAAQACLERSRYGPEDIDVLINASISRYRGPQRQRFEPPLSLDVKRALGAHRAVSFDISNACAGMLTGTFILNDLVRRGAIRRGMVVSGENITGLATNAAHDVRTILSKQLASLTLGDAGVAAIVDRAPPGNPGILVAGFTTIAEHSRLCLAYPSKRAPGANMYTDAREIHRVAVADLPIVLKQALDESGYELGEIDWVIPHQTSARAIRKGIEELTQALGASPKHTVINVEEYGNTASTTHFVAMDRYLREERFERGDVVALIALASGLEIGVVVFQMDELVETYGHCA